MFKLIEEVTHTRTNWSENFEVKRSKVKATAVVKGTAVYRVSHWDHTYLFRAVRHAVLSLPWTWWLMVLEKNLISAACSEASPTSHLANSPRRAVDVDGRHHLRSADMETSSRPSALGDRAFSVHGSGYRVEQYTTVE